MHRLLVPIRASQTAKPWIPCAYQLCLGIVFRTDRTVTVTAVNDVPILTSIGAQESNEDELKNISISATDVDNVSLVFRER